MTKRDPIAALTEIRAICNDPHTTGRPSAFVLAQIERICRHALEDYDEPPKEEPSPKKKASLVQVAAALWLLAYSAIPGKWPPRKTPNDR